MHSFTSEDLLLYLYKEASPSKSAAIEAAAVSDWSLREELSLLSSTQKQLESIEFSPRQQTIDNILSYAEKGMEEISQPA